MKSQQKFVISNLASFFHYKKRENTAFNELLVLKQEMIKKLEK